MSFRRFESLNIRDLYFFSEFCRFWASKWPPFGKSTTPPLYFSNYEHPGFLLAFAGPSRGVFGGRSEVSKVYFGSKILISGIRGTNVSGGRPPHLPPLGNLCTCHSTLALWSSWGKQGGKPPLYSQPKKSTFATLSVDFPGCEELRPHKYRLYTRGSFGNLGTPPSASAIRRHGGKARVWVTPVAV